MYYYNKWIDVYVIRKKHDENFFFGPFNNDSDAHMICEMLNAGSLLFPEDVDYGKKDIEDTHTVY